MISRSLFKFTKYLFFILFGTLTLNSEANTVTETRHGRIVLLMIYETNKSLDINRAVLYYSRNEWLKMKHDSLVIDFQNPGAPDTILYQMKWDHPVFLKLKLKAGHQQFESQVFSNSGRTGYYDVHVSDTSLLINPKLSSGNYERNSSLKALVLVLEAIFEMFIAFLIVRGFGISSLLILMVLVANVAAYPLYLFNISILNREILIFLVKVVVMSLVGLRKIKVYQILIIVSVLSLISLGIKEFLFFLIRLI